MIHDELEPTTKAGGRALAAQLADVATRAVERGRATHDRLLAIAISTPGVVDRDTGRVRLAYNVSPDGALDPLGAVGSRFGVPVLIDNNINLAALGEKSFGLARGVSTMVFIGIGAGVGMGIIMHDELVRGAHGAAGEIAYLPLVGDPFDPRHKLHGGLEDEIGAAGVLAGFAARAPARTAEVATAQDVFELARTGDGDAGAVVEHIAARLGSAIATVCAILDPELVVLGGGIGSSPLLLSPVRGAAAALVPLTARIETSLLGDQAALRGAIAFALHAARSQLIPQGAARREPRARRADPLDTHEETHRMAAIEIQDVSKRYRDGTLAVHDLSLQIADGEFTVLVGPSGCGKTTLLRMIAGLEEISAGTISIGDRVVNDLTPKDRDIAMVFQNYALYPHMTVARNMGFALRRAKVPAEEISRKVRARRRPAGHLRPAGAQARQPVGRPAPAGGDGPRHRPRPPGLPHGRAPLQPRRQAAHPDAGRDHAHPAPAAHDHGLRHPRPDRGDDARATGWR